MSLTARRIGVTTAARAAALEESVIAQTGHPPAKPESFDFVPDEVSAAHAPPQPSGNSGGHQRGRGCPATLILQRAAFAWIFSSPQLVRRSKPRRQALSGDPAAMTAAEHTLSSVCALRRAASGARPPAWSRPIRVLKPHGTRIAEILLTVGRPIAPTVPGPCGKYPNPIYVQPRYTAIAVPAVT